MQKLRQQARSVTFAIIIFAYFYFFLLSHSDPFKKLAETGALLGITWTFIPVALIYAYESFFWKYFNMQIDFTGYWDFTENQYEWHPSRVMRKDYSAWGHMRIVQDTRSISIVEGQTHKGKQGQTLEQELSDWWSDSCDLDASSKIITATIGHKSSGVRVGYEIIESYKKNNGLLGIYIHNLRDRLGYTDSKGANPFDNVYITSIDGSKTYFSSIYPTYDWVNGNGRQNIGAWIEGAAKRAGR